MFLFHGTLYFGGPVTRPPRDMGHLKAPRLTENFMPNAKGRAEREARVACSGLHENLFEGHSAEDFAIRHAVECHTAGEAERLDPGMRIQLAEFFEEDLFEAGLQTGGNVFVFLLKGNFGPSGRTEARLEIIRIETPKYRRFLRISPAHFRAVTMMSEVRKRQT